MNIVRRLQLLLYVAILISYQADAAEGSSAQEIMAISKIAGACGILDSMLYFQKTTKMPVGDEFVSRFWNTEATRLGLTMQQYSDQCDKALITYEKLWQALDKTE